MPRRFGEARSVCAAARTWLTVPGALSSVSRYMVWIESMTTISGPRRRDRARRRCRDAGRGGELHRRVGDAEPRGAQPHLIDRLFAGDIGSASPPCVGERGERPAAAAWICRCRDRRRPAAPSPARGRRRRRGRIRRCRSGAAAAPRASPCRPIEARARAALAAAAWRGFRRRRCAATSSTRVFQAAAAHRSARPICGWTAPHYWQTNWPRAWPERDRLPSSWRHRALGFMPRGLPSGSGRRRGRG